MVIDDWAMAPLSEPERRDFWEVCEERYQRRSMVLTSQLPILRWHERLAIRRSPTAFLDRLWRSYPVISAEFYALFAFCAVDPLGIRVQSACIRSAHVLKSFAHTSDDDRVLLANLRHRHILSGRLLKLYRSSMRERRTLFRDDADHHSGEIPITDRSVATRAS
jgi:hypothetical protein